MKTVIIIGGVAGGATVAARLRRNDDDVRIILFERGPYISYANCGLPYYTGNVIKKKHSLLLQTPERLQKRFNVDVRIRQEVIAIDREAKCVLVADRANGNNYVETYDELVLATGSSPVTPKIPGSDLPMIRKMWTVDDADAIREEMMNKNLKRVVVVGGGFIGIEAAENLAADGAEVTVVELSSQVLNQFDPEMALMAENILKANGVKLRLNTRVTSFEACDGGVRVDLSDKSSIEADLIINAVGIRPNSELAVDAGLEVNKRGAVVTDEHMRTSDGSIFAVGDVAEIERFVDHRRFMLQLAGPANKQARVVANILAGKADRYTGAGAASIIKLFSSTAAATGMNEKTLLSYGYKREVDYKTVIVMQKSHAAYYPNPGSMIIKLIFSPDGQKIFGAQIVGGEGVDKRIDVISTVIRLGGGVPDLTELDLAYSPPYSSAKDPVNMVGYVAENLMNDMVRFSDWDVPLNDENTVYVDVREDKERDEFSLPGTLNIPMDQLRTRMNEIDPDKKVIIFCAAGIRAYNAARLLMNHGYQNVFVYPGGVYFYRCTHAAESSEKIG